MTNTYWEKTLAEAPECPLCEQGHVAEETITVPVYIYPLGSHEPQMWTMTRSTYERLVAPMMLQTMKWMESQRQAARNFRYSRMVYKGARNGKR